MSTKVKSYWNKIEKNAKNECIATIVAMAFGIIVAMIILVIFGG